MSTQQTPEKDDFPAITTEIRKEITKLPQSPEANLKDLNPYHTSDEQPPIVSIISPEKNYQVNQEEIEFQLTVSPMINKNTLNGLELKNQTVAKSTALDKGDQMAADIPQLKSDIRGPEKDDFTPIHQYVPSYLEQSDNSVVILSQDLGKSAKKSNAFEPMEQLRVIKSPESIKQGQQPLLKTDCPNRKDDWSSEQVQAKIANIEIKKLNEVTDFQENLNKENINEEYILANLSKIDFCQFDKEFGLDKKSNGTIEEEEGEASDDIVSTNKKPKLDDYKSMSFGEKKELIPRFNGTIPPPPAPLAMMRPPPPPCQMPIPPPPPHAVIDLTTKSSKDQNNLQKVHVKFVYEQQALSVFNNPQTVNKDVMMKKLTKYFSKVQNKSRKNSPEKTVMGNLNFFCSQNLVRFDGILDQKRSFIIASTVAKFPQLQEGMIETFMANINNGNGSEFEKTDIDQFISILPSETEIQLFKDKLEEQNLGSFEELDNLKPPKQLRKMEKGDWFIIQVLKNEKVIENAKTIQNIMEFEKQFNDINSQHSSWVDLAQQIIRGDQARTLEMILGLALQISTQMSNGLSQEPTAFDITKSLMIFFDKKSNIQLPVGFGGKSPRATSQKIVLYDVLLRILIKDLASLISEGEDKKLQAMRAVKEIFTQSTIDLINLCSKNEISSIISSLDAMEVNVNKNIRARLQNWNVRQSSENFQQMMMEFIKQFDHFVVPKIQQIKDELLEIQIRFKSHFCIQSQETSVDELLSLLIDFDVKHKEKVEKMILMRGIKLKCKPKDEGKAKKVPVASYRPQTQRTTPRTSPTESKLTRQENSIKNTLAHRPPSTRLSRNSKVSPQSSLNDTFRQSKALPQSSLNDTFRQSKAQEKSKPTERVSGLRVPSPRLGIKPSAQVHQKKFSVGSKQIR